MGKSLWGAKPQGLSVIFGFLISLHDDMTLDFIEDEIAFQCIGYFLMGGFLARGLGDKAINRFKGVLEAIFQHSIFKHACTILYDVRLNGFSFWG
jgi:hypothetical protein